MRLEPRGDEPAPRGDHAVTRGDDVVNRAVNENSSEPLVSKGGIYESVRDKELVVALHVGGLARLCPLDRNDVSVRRRLVNNVNVHVPSICARAL